MYGKTGGIPATKHGLVRKPCTNAADQWSMNGNDTSHAMKNKLTDLDGYANHAGFRAKDYVV